MTRSCADCKASHDSVAKPKRSAPVGIYGESKVRRERMHRVEDAWLKGKLKRERPLRSLRYVYEEIDGDG